MIFNYFSGHLAKKFDEVTQERETGNSAPSKIRCALPAANTSLAPSTAENECTEFCVHRTRAPIEQFFICQPLAYLFAFLFLDMMWEVMFGLAFDKINVDESN